MLQDADWPHTGGIGNLTQSSILCLNLGSIKPWEVLHPKLNIWHVCAVLHLKRSERTSWTACLVPWHNVCFLLSIKYIKNSWYNLFNKNYMKFLFRKIFSGDFQTLIPSWPIFNPTNFKTSNEKFSPTYGTVGNRTFVFEIKGRALVGIYGQAGFAMDAIWAYF